MPTTMGIVSLHPSYGTRVISNAVRNPRSVLRRSRRILNSGSFTTFRTSLTFVRDDNLTFLEVTTRALPGEGKSEGMLQAWKAASTCR
jgi:hypothetical protein